MRAASLSLLSQSMHDAADWQFAVEVHPPDWRFPAGPSWLAGWIHAGSGPPINDLRAWVDQRLFLGVPGQPKPGLDEKLLGRPGPPYAGFVLRVTPHRGARLLRLEARDTSGRWREFFRTAITVADDAPAPSVPASLAGRLPKLVPALLRLRSMRPTAKLALLADEIVAGLIAEPLDTLPNPPFHGALEEPCETGRVRYGRLTVTGWLAHRTTGIRRLTGLADAVPECPLLHGLPRADVGGEFSDLPGREHAQFAGQVDLPPVSGTPVLVKVFAELENGEKHLVFTRRFNPTLATSADMPVPPGSKLSYMQALWALHRASDRHGLPPGSWGERIAAIKAPWSAGKKGARLDGQPRRTPVHVAPSTVPLRLVVVTHNLNFEGAPRLAFELARFLHQQPGGSVRVRSPQEGPMRRLFEEAGMPVEVVDVSPALAATSPAEFHSALGQAVKLDWTQVDLLIANSLLSFWAIHAAKQAGKPSLLYVHESAPVARFLEPALVPLAEAAFHDATRVVFTAGASRAVFAQFDAGNFRVRPSWLDVAAIDTFAAAHKQRELRARLGIDLAAVVLLNLGAVCERKGQHTFLRAAALLEPELRQRHPERSVEFVMVGTREDDYLALLRLQAADAGLQRVRFVPETRENFAWLRLADILVCTSFEESSPRVLLEAASFGLPIVSTNVNGIPELVTEDEAWLVGPGDPHQLAEAIRQALAAHLTNNTGLAERARRTVAARFDERISLPQHLALAQEAAACHT